MSDSATVLVAVAALGVLTCGLLAGAWTRQRLGTVAAALFAVAVATWIIDLVAVGSGYRDTDGFVDCGDSCTTTQRLAAVGFVAPPLLVALAAAGMLVAVIARARRKRHGA